MIFFSGVAHGFWSWSTEQPVLLVPAPWPGRLRVARAKLRGVEDAGKPPGAFPLLHRRRRGVSGPEQKRPERSSVFFDQGPRVEIRNNSGFQMRSQDS